MRSGRTGSSACLCLGSSKDCPLLYCQDAVTEEYQINSTLKIEILNNITQDYLAQIGFEWPDVTADYLNKVLDYMKRVGFLR